jgi:hypothetical protein
VPFDTQVEIPVAMTSGWPFDVTRVAALVQVPVTHALPLEASEQPVIAYCVGCTTVGWPDTSTRAFGALGSAGPRCEQLTCAPM